MFQGGKKEKEMMLAGNIRAMETEESHQGINLDVHEDVDTCTMKFCSSMRSRTVFTGQWMKCISVV